MNGTTIPEDNEPLLELIRNYVIDDNEANGEAVMHEFRHGHAELYVAVERGTMNPVRLQFEGRSLNAFQAATDVDVAMAEENYRDTPNELILFPAAGLAQYMLSCPVMMLMVLNKDRGDEIGVIYDKNGWRIAAIGKKKAAMQQPRASIFTGAERKGRMK